MLVAPRSSLVSVCSVLSPRRSRTRGTSCHLITDGFMSKHVVVPAKGEYLYQRVVHGNLKPEGDPDNPKIRYRQGFEYALEWHRANTGSYPETLAGLLEPPKHNAETWLGPYLAPEYTEVPKDPWGRELIYERQVTPEGESYSLSSSGPDGFPGNGDDLSHRDLDELYPRCGPSINIEPLLHQGTRGFLFGMVTFWVKFFARTLLYAYLVAYFFCAQTTLYFFLRRDVEGDDYSEIVINEPDDRFPQPAGPAPAPKDEGGGKDLPMAGGGGAEA